MEVHAHSHTERKKFTHYLWEFLMLFLAVFCGFLAENIREHTVEKQRAKVLAQSMFEDLKKDTAALHAAIFFSNKKLNASDSILVLLHRPRNQWNDTNFYKNMAPIMTAFPFISTDGTYAQMKTSGSLRYFNQYLVNQMNAYDVQLKKTRYRDDVEDKGLWVLAPYNMDLINLEIVTDIRFNLPITHDLYIKMDNKTITDKYINLIVMIKTFRTRSLQEYETQLKIADKLIEALQKSYHL
jgi:hypothetical protein